MARKEYHEDFRFKVRNGIYYVIYKTNPSRMRSTGQRTEDAAVKWAYRNIEAPLVGRMLLSAYTRHFFTEKCTWRQRMLEKGHTYNPGYFRQHRSRLENYIIPDLGNFTLDAITTKQLDRWLMGLKNKDSGKSLAPETKMKMVTCLDKIFSEAKYDGLITENPVKGIATFQDTTPEKLIFSLEEIRQMFPVDRDELLRIWQSQMWLTYFMVQAYCGLRPGEVKAIRPAHWFRDLGVIIIKDSMEHGTNRAKGLKTSKRGVKKKPAVLPDRANQELLLLEAEGNIGKDDLFFTLDGKPIILDTANKHLRASLERAGISHAGRTQTCFRHSYNTHLHQVVTLEQLQMAMGHVTDSMTRRYLHPEDAKLAEKAVKIKGAVEKLFGQTIE